MHLKTFEERGDSHKRHDSVIHIIEIQKGMFCDLREDRVCKSLKEEQGKKWQERTKKLNSHMIQNH